MSKLDKYYRVIQNQNSNDFNDKPEYVIQTLYSDDKHLSKSQYKTGNGEWREFSKNNPIFSRLEDACGALIRKCCKDKYQQLQTYKKRWEKLKKYILTNREVLLYAKDEKQHSIGDLEANYFERIQLLNKMRELEKEGKDESRD